jgi:hypothetical protein
LGQHHISHIKNILYIYYHLLDMVTQLVTQNGSRTATYSMYLRIDILE